MKVLGIDFGATKIRGAIVDEDGKLSEEREVVSLVEEGRDAVTNRLRGFIDEYLQEVEGIEAVGIGSPGPVDYLAGTVLNPPNLPGWEVVPLREILQNALTIPVTLDRDANCALFAEHWVGEAQGLRNVVLLTWGTGVGGAVIINGVIERGRSNLAGEIGHMIIDKDGPACHMGHCGCLESFIGGEAVEKRYGKRLETIAEGARRGVEKDKKIIVEISKALVVGLKNIMTLFDPELIVIDGGAVQSIDVFLEVIKDFPVKVSRLAMTAGVIGAGKIAIDHLEKQLK